MKNLGTFLLCAAVTFSAGACQRDKSDKKTEPSAVVKPGVTPGATGPGAKPPGRPPLEQVAPPFDVKTPPADAVKTASGLAYKVITSVADGAKPGKNDTVMVNYVGWKQPSGETFVNTKQHGRPAPMALPQSPPGMAEALQLLKKGEKAMLWIPAAIAYRTPPKAAAEGMAFEVEIVDIQAAPAVPADVGAPPASAHKTKSGIAYIEVKPGSGDKLRSFDNAVFNFSSWDASGLMLESTEMRKRSVTMPPFRQPAPMEEVLTLMSAGQRLRVWFPPTALPKPPTAAEGMLTYEIELAEIKKQNPPPAVPKDVAAPPAKSEKTEKGVSYAVLKKGKGSPHPAATDVVRVHYTGWTTDGRMFDSSVVRGEPTEFPLNGVIAGWTDGLQKMSPGDSFRFWIPQELAYKGAPGKPQGMLVFDVELLEIKPPPPAGTPAPGRPHGGPGGPGMSGGPGGPGGPGGMKIMPPAGMPGNPNALPPGHPPMMKPPASAPPAGAPPATPPK
jgi:FKBP-type peptidyl-prolyl cis-trans isomerase